MYIWSVDLAFRSLYFGMLDVDCLTAVRFEVNVLTFPCNLSAILCLLLMCLKFFSVVIVWESCHAQTILFRIVFAVIDGYLWLCQRLQGVLLRSEFVLLRVSQFFWALHIVAWWSCGHVRNHAVIYIIAFAYFEHTIFISEFFWVCNFLLDFCTCSLVQRLRFPYANHILCWETWNKQGVLP